MKPLRFRIDPTWFICFFSVMAALGSDALEYISDAEASSIPALWFNKPYSSVEFPNGERDYLRWLLNDQVLMVTSAHHPDPNESNFVFEAGVPKSRFPSGRDPYYFGRLFWIDRQFELWAGALLFRDEKGSYSELCKKLLVKIYRVDLYVQKRVEELKLTYADDNSVVIAGLTGSEVIAYMEEFLPEPDPRAFIESKPKVVRPSNLKDGRKKRVTGDSGSGDRDETGKSNDGWIWLLAALVIASLGGVGILSRGRR